MSLKRHFYDALRNNNTVHYPFGSLRLDLYKITGLSVAQGFANGTDAERTAFGDYRYPFTTPDQLGRLNHLRGDYRGRSDGTFGEHACDRLAVR